ncbi:hypothetical protein EHW64_06995 [Erwinia psidii]|nr:hypothetical protein [Erwinia psidii]MCX8960925.1 hypothetical protein [Erwinia psidii]
MDLLVPGMKQSMLLSENINNFNLQLGYYDLLSKNSEIYNPHVDIRQNTVVMKLSDPDDNRMQIIIHMKLKKVTPQGIWYGYKSVSVPEKSNDLLIANTLGYLQNQHILFSGISYPGGKVTVTSLGLIISRP